MRVNFQYAILATGLNLFNEPFLHVPCDSAHKVTYRNFEISIFLKIEI